jgi:C4-dicarboxylate-specific signal transduction histidine kinase
MILNKKTTLSSVIRNEYVRSIVFPLLIIELTLLIAYFWSNSFVNTGTQIALINETKINIQEISKRSAYIINNEFKSVSNATKLFQSRHQEFFDRFNTSNNKQVDASYITTSDGVINNLKTSDQQCSLLYSNVFKNKPNRLQKAIASQELDPFYNSILSINNNIAQVYFNSYDSMNRLCPYIDNALDQYPHNVNTPKYNFYYLADKTHNPKKEVVWTDAYLDPAGQGWMISAIAPVYQKDFLEGVVGIDVTLEKILLNILSIKLPYTSFALLVDKNGNIIAMNQQLEPMVGIKELTSHNYIKPIIETISKPKNFNINQQKNPLIQKIGTIVQSNTSIDEFHSDEHNFLITQNTINETGWKLILLVDEDSLLANTVKLKNKIDNLGYIILSLMAAFYILFFIIIIRRSQKFSKVILDPIKNLVDATNILKNDLQSVKVQYSKINEIDTLIDNFCLMGDDLIDLYSSMQNRIQEGIKKNLETQKVMIYQSRLAAMGEMISMIAHQWRQPINVIALESNNILIDIELKTIHESTLREAILNTLHQTQELSKTIDDFSNFFRPEKSVHKIELQTVFDDVNSVIGKSLSYDNIILEIPKDTQIVLTTYSRELMQVLINLIKNSKDAFEENPINTKKITLNAVQKDKQVTITVCDTAGGIDNNILDKIFDPYFSTKKEKNGTGLGLYMSKTIIEKHLLGTLDTRNTKDGICFYIILPLCTVQASP